MATIKTRPTGESVTAFLDSVTSPRRSADGHATRALMERITGQPATMWGPSMVGFGTQTYTNTTGSNEWPVVGFSPRKTALTIYGIYNGYGEPDPLFEKLGPHTTGKGCVYIKSLEAVDMAVLERLIVNAWTDPSIPGT